jgi:hypothetical protein
MRSSRTALIIALLALPAPAAAQACLGVFTEDSGSLLEGIYTTTGGRQTYGARAVFNFSGPLSTYATYDIAKYENINERGQRFGGGAALELMVPKISMCPVGGLSHSRLKFEDETGAELTLSQTVIPFGLGIGKVLPASETVFWVIYGQPEFQYIRSKAQLEGTESDDRSETDTQNEFGFHMGMRIGWRWFYGGAGAELSSIDESDPVFSLVGAITVR